MPASKSPKTLGSETSRHTSRDDWLTAALQILIHEGIEQVKVLRLAQELGVARSSFYWFFDSRGTLLDLLLQSWAAKNTGAIISRARAQTETIAGGVLKVFECWTDNAIFDARLDFAIREWARRAPDIRAAIEAADDMRITALSEMFLRHDFPPQQAFIRARILYFTQIGYFSLVGNETMEERRIYVDDYVLGFTGQRASTAELDRFAGFIGSGTRH